MLNPRVHTLCQRFDKGSQLTRAGVGRVVKNGPGASKFQPGQRVVAVQWPQFEGHGSWRTHAALPEKILVGPARPSQHHSPFLPCPLPCLAPSVLPYSPSSSTQQGSSKEEEEELTTIPYFTTLNTFTSRLWACALSSLTCTRGTKSVLTCMKLCKGGFLQGQELA